MLFVHVWVGVRRSIVAWAVTSCLALSATLPLHSALWPARRFTLCPQRGLRSFTRTLRRSTSSRSTATVRRSTQRRPFLHICAAASSALLGLFGATPASAHVTQRVRLVCQACFQRCGCDRLPSRARARAHIIRNAGARQMRRLHRGTPRSLSTEHGVSQRLRVICMRRTRVCAQNGAG